MADFPEPMLAGSVSLSGKVPTILAQGVTFELASTSRNEGFKVPMRAMTAFPLSHTFTVEELQKNVSTAIGYVPANVTVLGFSIISADLETGGPTTVQSLLLGETTLITGITAAQAGTNAFYPVAPTAVSVPTVVYLKVTTAGATPVAGAASVHAYYYSN